MGGLQARREPSRIVMSSPRLLDRQKAVVVDAGIHARTGIEVGGRRMNRGGFSWWRLFGVSAFKSRVSREFGIPLTRTGRRQKLGSVILRLLGLERWV